jgi:hypothetical protein
MIVGVGAIPAPTIFMAIERAEHRLSYASETFTLDTRMCKHPFRTYRAVAFTFLLPLAAYASPAMVGVVPRDVPTGAVLVSVPLPAGEWAGKPLSAIVSVEGQPGPQRISAQYEPADGLAEIPARAWFVWPGIEEARGKRISVDFEPAGAAAKPAYVSKHADPLLNIAGPDAKPILSYWHGLPQSGSNPPLNDFIHPLVGLDGEILTELRPADHLHHRGIFWAWVRHEEGGKAAGDWWHPTDIRCEPGKLDFVDGPVMTRFTARHFWIHQPGGAAQGKRFVEELVIGRVFATSKEGRALDVDITLTALEDGVRIGGTLELEKGYGGYTIRYSQGREAQVVADGKSIKKDINQLRAGWVDWSAILNKLPGQPNTERTGAAVFVSPSHPDYPPQWITRNYGVLNVSYPGLKMLELPKGRPLRLRYRTWIHRGDAQQGLVDSQYKAYVADWKWTPQGTAATQAAPAPAASQPASSPAK